MAKGKSANPADAYRKALRKKELKKNKAERSKARDFALVKKDTRDIEEEIEKLEANAHLPPSEKAHLKELKDDLMKIMKKKEEYVVEHPEHRKLVFKTRKPQAGTSREGDNQPELKTRKLFGKNGLPKHPERSIYYDPVMNPFGMPPPGMPYIERPLRPDEIASASDEERSGDSDDDIVLPPGPPPGQPASEDYGDDDNIVMPEGPPPPKKEDQTPPLPPLPLFPPPSGMHLTYPSLPASIAPGLSAIPQSRSYPFPLPPGTSPPGPPLLPTLGFAPHPLPPPPPGFFPRYGQGLVTIQDPLSHVPHETYQSRRISRTNDPPHPTLPPKPGAAPQENAITTHSATVSAEPELRDLKKESTAFVPLALKRKKANASGSLLPPKVNAAPLVGSTDGPDVSPSEPRPDLLGALKDQFGTTIPRTGGSQNRARPADDYARFMEEMNQVL